MNLLLIHNQALLEAKVRSGDGAWQLSNDDRTKVSSKSYGLNWYMPWIFCSGPAWTFAQGMLGTGSIKRAQRS